LISGLEAEVDNGIHIKVEIIELDAIWVWQGGVDALSFIFTSFNHNGRILVCQPPIERWHTHLSSLFLAFSLSLTLYLSPSLLRRIVGERATPEQMLNTQQKDCHFLYGLLTKAKSFTLSKVKYCNYLLRFSLMRQLHY
jgi:hypothetical protein